MRGDIMLIDRFSEEKIDHELLSVCKVAAGHSLAADGNHARYHYSSSVELGFCHKHTLDKPCLHKGFAAKAKQVSALTEV